MENVGLHSYCFVGSVTSFGEPVYSTVRSQSWRWCTAFSELERILKAER